MDGQSGGRIDFAFLDSGTGGIPYMIELKKKNPHARCVYLGDTEHFPYGEKSSQEVTDCAAASIKRIVEQWNPLTLVIACNTISVTSLDELRRLFPELPIVGTVPAIRLAARVSQNKKIGLLATNATVRHPYCMELVKNFASDCEIFKRGDPELISFIEHSFFEASEEERFAAVKPAVDYFAANGCDTIILGCTHYTHVASYIQRSAGEKVHVVDSRDGVANQALKVETQKLKDSSPLSAGLAPLPPDRSFFVTKLDSEKDRAEYEDLCRNFDIPWGGVLR